MNHFRQTRPDHWARINESTFIYGIRFLFWICKVFGRWPFRIFLYPVLVWYILTKPVARQSSWDYLEKLGRFQGNKKHPVHIGQIFMHFASFGESILDKLLLWSNHYPVNDIVLHGTAPFNDYIDRKKGCLLICSHLGNLELCKVMSHKKPGLKVTMLVHTKHAQAFNELLGQLSPESQFNLMQVTEISPTTVLILHEKIKNGEFVIIAGDRVPVSSVSRTTSTSFLGHDALFPVGPYVLANLLQCPVYLMFPILLNGKSEIHFEFFRESIHLPRKNRDAILSELANDFAKRLQHYCLMAPMQWFNFYPFWQTASESK